MPRHQSPERVQGQYLLGCIGEEAGEVVQIKGKIDRHGWESVDPTNDSGDTNRMLLEQELGDLLGAARFAARQGFLDLDRIEKFALARSIKLSAICPEDELDAGPLCGAKSEGFHLESCGAKGRLTYPVRPDLIIN